MLATNPAARLFFKRALTQGVKTTARALSTQASSGIWTSSLSSLVRKDHSSFDKMTFWIKELWPDEDISCWNRHDKMNSFDTHLHCCYSIDSTKINSIPFQLFGRLDVFLNGHCRNIIIILGKTTHLCSPATNQGLQEHRCQECWWSRISWYLQCVSNCHWHGCLQKGGNWLPWNHQSDHHLPQLDLPRTLWTRKEE